MGYTECEPTVNRCPAAKVAKVVGLVMLGIIGAAVLAIIFGLVIQWLWNQLMPDIFGLPQVSYWQAVGLVILGHILFGGGHSHHSRAESRKGKNKVTTKDQEERHWDSFRDFWNEYGREAFDRWLNGREKPAEE